MLKNRVEALERSMPSAEGPKMIWIRFLAPSDAQPALRSCSSLGQRYVRGDDETEEAFERRVEDDVKERNAGRMPVVFVLQESKSLAS